MSQQYLAVIREDECIGCTKCIAVCPVDAILGSSMQMHTVIADECIGCKLCIPPCPVDCIDLIAMPETQERLPAMHVKGRYQARKVRLEGEKNDELAVQSMMQKKQYLAEAIARAKEKSAGR